MIEEKKKKRNRPVDKELIDKLIAFVRMYEQSKEIEKIK
jgi:hypothetical protein